MNYTDIKSKSVSELNTLLKEKKVLLFTLKRQLKTMQLTNPNQIGEAKKEIARIKTALNELKRESK